MVYVVTGSEYEDPPSAESEGRLSNSETIESVFEGGNDRVFKSRLQQMIANGLGRSSGHGPLSEYGKSKSEVLRWVSPRDPSELRAFYVIVPVVLQGPKSSKAFSCVGYGETLEEGQKACRFVEPCSSRTGPKMIHLGIVHRSAAEYRI